MSGDISQYCVDGPPTAIYYITDFLSEAEEETILSKIPPNRWISLSHRRLQALPAQLTSKNTLLASPLPSWLSEPAVQRIESLGVFRQAPHGINHCLINEYLPGQGILAHEDGDAYHPVVATISLGSTLVLDVTAKPGITVPNIDTESKDHQWTLAGSERWRIVQEPRSLLVTTASAYRDTLHGIAEVEEDVNVGPSTIANWNLLSDRGRSAVEKGHMQREKRISLTFRDVKRVSSLGTRLLGRKS